MANKIDHLQPADIVQVAQEVLGSAPVNGKTGRVQKRLHEIYQGRPMSIDSARTAVRLSSWTDEADKTRLETLFQYGLCEAFNYNAAVMTEKFGAQGGSIQNLEDSYKNKDMPCLPTGVHSLTLRAILPETIADPALMTQEKLEVEKPGCPGEMVDLRAIAASIHLTSSSSSDRWRQLAREILDKVVPKEVQCVYSAATKASMYFPLPPAFLDGIVQCCAISSGLTAQSGAASYLPAIASHVRTALGFKLNEIKKGKSKDIEVLVRDAVSVGWTPPGISRAEALKMYTGDTSIEIKYEEELAHLDDNEEAWPSYDPNFTPGIKNPTAHLKRRGPIAGTRRSDRKRRPNEYYTDNEGTPEGMMLPRPNLTRQDIPSSSREEWLE